MGEAKVYFSAMWSDHLLKFCFILYYAYICESEYRNENGSTGTLSHKVSEALVLDLYEDVKNFTLILGLNSSAL